MRRFPQPRRPEFAVLERLDSPLRIQAFVDRIPMNFEPEGNTCWSPLTVLRKNQAHCMEAAMLAAAAFWYHGEKPMLLDLKAARNDDDHVVALFRENGRWGAVSKTNHAVLRYRDPVYETVRELVMSYFNEYFLDSGRKTLRSYSDPFDLSRLGGAWLAAPHDLWDVFEALDSSPHRKIVDSKTARRLRPADPIEIQIGKFVQWKAPRPKKSPKPESTARP
jgi:hypothetical protein